VTDKSEILAANKKIVLPADAQLDRLIHDPSPEILVAVAADQRLTEDLALAFLNRRDLPPEALQELHRNSSLAKLPKVRLAVAAHPRTPRHVSLPLLRALHTFELMQLALLPAVAPDMKRSAEEVLMSRLGTLSSGERLTLAKQASSRVAAALLTTKEERVLQAALLNPRMTEVHIVKALKAETGTDLLAPAVARHPKWFHRIEVKAALLGNRHTPFARAVQIAAELPLHALKDVLRNSHLPPNVRGHLREVLAKRAGSAG
jgi:hypothetical protein